MSQRTGTKRKLDFGDEDEGNGNAGVEVSLSASGVAHVSREAHLHEHNNTESRQAGGSSRGPDGEGSATHVRAAGGSTFRALFNGDEAAVQDASDSDLLSAQRQARLVSARLFSCRFAYVLASLDGCCRARSWRRRGFAY